ncbi:MAG TPA: 2-C-methyl-D-erythritol 2,4-cyclodiphosphate synthase [Myxococcota bacterium]|jgi:2-C-methyl-D-erythritol 2,4-cyclodiphosphate synthase
MTRARIGHGFDAHQLAEGYELVIGGVAIPYARGLAGHSDGDVLLHAIASALLGALGLGDLGAHFPSSDPRWKGVASAEFVRHALALARERGFELGNLDATVIAERPRLAPHQPAMRREIADLLGASEADVNVKLTSTDGLGALGRGEGIAAHAVVLLVPAGGA